MKYNARRTMRILHRYLGFFLVGIMGVYALSGTVMIFRTTDFLKKERTIEIKLEPHIVAEDLGRYLRIRDFRITDQDNNTVFFESGTYDRNTGIALHTEMRLPVILEKMTGFHKATTDSPLFFLNIFFGFSLLFFVVSTFWMFALKSSPFKKGLFFTLGGIILALILLLI